MKVEVERNERKPDTSEESCSNQNQDLGGRKADPSQDKAVDSIMSADQIAVIDQLNELVKERTRERDR